MFRKTIYIFFTVLLSCGICFTQGVDTLTATSTTVAPTVDGTVDALWNSIPQVIIPLGETYDTQNPASITDCAGCHSYNSPVNVTLKAVYTTTKLYILATWMDSTVSFTRGGAWSYTNSTWEKLNSDQSEDRISFYWPIGSVTGSPYNKGCMAKCHMYYPTDTDPHVSTHGIVDDAWLSSGKADMWHSKAGRGAGLTSTSGSNLTIDAVTHQVTGGIFTMIGYADDKYVSVWADDATNGEDGGRYGDAGTSAYSHNRIGDKSRPKYMEKAPTNYGDAMILTQAEIDAGEVVGDATTGVSNADAATYWPAYSALKAIIPERILRQPLGSRADIKFGSQWSNNTWTVEIERDLNTGNDDDVQFDINNTYEFGVAEFDNSRHGYQHRTSKTYSLKFDKTTGIEIVDNTVPDSYVLANNYPNPFNPSTQIKFSIPEQTNVKLLIYDVLGREVSQLVNQVMQAGTYTFSWNAKGYSSGVYFYKLQTDNFVKVRKMMLLK